MAQKHTSAQDHAATFTDKQKKTALIVVATAFVIDLLDSTIMLKRFNRATYEEA